MGEFFTHAWYVMDLIVVIVSLICETMLEKSGDEWIAMCITLRLWKIVSLIFDFLLERHDQTEVDRLRFQVRNIIENAPAHERSFQLREVLDGPSAHSSLT